MPDEYPRSIEPVIAVVLGCISWKNAQLVKCDGGRRMIDEQRR
jgi:hypothetical protein